MDMLSSFLDPGEAYRRAGDDVGQYWNEAKGYEQPFQQAGTGEIGHLQNFIQSLSDPAALESQWAGGYQESPYAKDLMQRSQNIGLDAASSMGLMGSTPALENIQRTGSSIMNADRQQYLKDLMDKYMAGVQTSKSMFGTGAQAGNVLSQGALRTGENMAQADYGEAAAPGQLFGKMLGTAAGVGASALAGPGGGMIVKSLMGGGSGGGAPVFGTAVNKYLPSMFGG